MVSALEKETLSPRRLATVRPAAPESRTSAETESPLVGLARKKEQYWRRARLLDEAQYDIRKESADDTSVVLGFTREEQREADEIASALGEALAGFEPTTAAEAVIILEQAAGDYDLAIAISEAVGAGHDEEKNQLIAAERRVLRCMFGLLRFLDPTGAIRSDIGTEFFQTLGEHRDPWTPSEERAAAVAAGRAKREG